MKTLLEGIKAIDWGAFANGPIVGVMLGDLGADVIKIESPEAPDPSRGMKSMYGGPLELSKGKHALTEIANRNKRSITINLKDKQSKKLVERLVENTDIFCTNYSMSTARKLGMDYKTLSEYNPRLIYCNASGFGTKGPDADKRSFDVIILARMGLMMAAREADGPPPHISNAIADTMGGTVATMAILAALAHRERTGVGQEVETSLLNSLIWLQYIGVQSYLLTGNIQKFHRLNTQNPMSNSYECEDGKWIIFGEPQSDRFWHEFCSALDAPHLEKDKRFENAMTRAENRQILIGMLDKIFSTKTRDNWIRKFEKDRVKFAYGPINDLDEAMQDPQVVANNYVVDYDHPVLGMTKQITFPAKFSKAEISIKRPAPEAGEHTEEILLEAGYSWDDITAFKDKEII